MLSGMFGELRIKFSSWNCRGLQKLKKVKQVMSRLKSMHSDVVFLQETHLLCGREAKIRRKWHGSMYSAPFTSQARGVLILIHKSISFHLTRVKLNLINIYGPNNDDQKFFFLTIPPLSRSYIITGGFNCTLNPELARS